MGVMSITAFAASAYKNPAEAVAGILGRTVESVASERVETGKTYGTIAAEAGKLDEFKSEMLVSSKDSLSDMVTSGRITQAQADTIILNIEENQATCDGTGNGNGCGGFGCNGSGNGINGNSQGAGMGKNQSTGRGTGSGGLKLQDGSCYITQ